MAREKEDTTANHRKADIRIKLDLSLLAICFTIFTFLIAINPAQLKSNNFVALQLVLAIPLLITAILAKTKMSYSNNEGIWDIFSFSTFLVAYSFIVNVIGILLASGISILASLIYFSGNIFLALVYSVITINYEKTKLIKRAVKDTIFIAILVLLGILPSLKIY